jgi:hypothetical protein
MVSEEEIFISYGSPNLKVSRAMGNLRFEHFIPTKNLDKGVLVNTIDGYAPHTSPVLQVESLVSIL